MSPQTKKLSVTLCLVVALVAGAFFGLLTWKRRAAKQLAESAVAQANWNQLSQVTTVWLESEPTNGEALYLAGLAAEHRGAGVRALQFYESVSPDQPKLFSQARLRLALLALTSDSPRDAEQYLIAAVEADEQNVAAWREWLRYLGLTYQQNRARKEAYRAIQSNADAPSAFVYLMAGDLVIYRDGESKTALWAQDDPDPELFEVAAFLHAVKRESLSEVPEDGEASVASDAFVTGASSLDSRFTQLVERYPNNTDLLFLQMQRALDSGDQQRLAQLLAKVPSSAADDPRSWRLKGQWLQLQDRLDEANAAYQTAIQCDPFDTRPYQFQSEIARLQGNDAEAERLQAIATAGNQLRRMIYTRREMDALDKSVFRGMASYAQQVRQPLVAERLTQRLELMP